MASDGTVSSDDEAAVIPPLQVVAAPVAAAAVAPIFRASPVHVDQHQGPYIHPQPPPQLHYDPRLVHVLQAEVARDAAARAAGVVPPFPPHVRERAPRKKTNPEANTNKRFSAPERDYLLDCVEEHLPIGRPLWEKVGAQYNAYYAPKNRGRALDNLRRKYNEMVKKLPPTGQGEIEPYIGRAKDIEKAIQNKADTVVYTGKEEEEIVGDQPEGLVEEQDGKPKAKNTTKKQGQRVHKKGDDMLSAFMVTEKAANRRERSRRRQEAQRMQLQQQNFQTMMGFVATVATAYMNKDSGGSNNNTIQMPNFSQVGPTINLNQSLTTSESSSDEDEKKKKKKKSKKRKASQSDRARKTRKGNTSDDEEEEEDGSGSESDGDEVE